MALTPEQQQSLARAVRRQVISQRVKEVVQEVIQSDLTADDIQSVFDAAAVTLHPFVVQNLLARRYAAQAQGS